MWVRACWLFGSWKEEEEEEEEEDIGKVSLLSAVAADEAFLASELDGLMADRTGLCSKASNVLGGGCWEPVDFALARGATWLLAGVALFLPAAAATAAEWMRDPAAMACCSIREDDDEEEEEEDLAVVAAADDAAAVEDVEDICKTGANSDLETWRCCCCCWWWWWCCCCCSCCCGWW